MATGYSRQSVATIQPNITIKAAPLNAEFDAIQAAFDNSTGHDHSGTSPGDGAKILLTSSVSGILPVANGGSGIGTSTGTAGNIVLSNSPTIVTPTIASITGPTTITGGGLTVSTGGILISAGGLTATGNSTITGTLNTTAGVTIAAGGLTATGTSVITGTFNATGGVSDNGSRVISINNKFAVLQATPSDPTFTTSTTGVMAGINQTLAPTTTGRFLIIINGNFSNNTDGNGVKSQIRYGTGSAPANGAALTGTAVGSTIQGTRTVAPATFGAFSLNVIITGLTLSTTYWIDLSQAAITGGNAAILNLSISVTEI